MAMASYPGSAAPQGQWRGNLPCCHGEKDGCANHNPHKTVVFFNRGLPSNARPASVGFLKSLLGSSGSRSDAAKLEKEAWTTPEIWSNVPLQPQFCDPLPLVHPSVPYSICFYHVNGIMARAAVGQDIGAALNALTCRGTSGSRPEVSWAVTPKVVGRSFLLEHSYAFTISLEHYGERPPTLVYKKNWLIFEGYRSFSGCPHCTYLYRAYREQVKNGMYYVGVEYSLKNVLGQEFKNEWRSEVGQQPQNGCCRMCYTDYALSFELSRGMIVVRFQAHKDLGGGMDPFEPKWLAALRGTDIQRDKADFGRMRTAFRGPVQRQQHAEAPPRQKA